MNYNKIEEKHRDLIDVAISYMSSINDKEHDINHMDDVVEYTKILLDNVKIDVDPDVCIICAYWHDVGRTKINKGHEKVSAEMLKEEMIKRNYPNEMIEKCVAAIEKHRWDMQPTTNEGLILKDADKLDFIGIKRWKSCIDNNQRLESIVDLLPDLRDKYMYFDEAKKIYDAEIVKLVRYLYEEMNNRTYQ